MMNSVSSEKSDRKSRLGKRNSDRGRRMAPGSTDGESSDWSKGIKVVESSAADDTEKNGL